MKYIFLLFCVVVYVETTWAQKPPIDSSVFGKWPAVASPQISNDGKFVLYCINNLPIGSSSLFVQSIDASWKVQFFNATTVNFTGNSRFATFKCGDTLGLLRLGTNNITYIPKIESYQIPEGGLDGWVAYLTKNSSHELVLRNVFTEQEKRFPYVLGYLFSNDGKVLLLKTEPPGVSNSEEAMLWVTLNNLNVRTIWSGTKAFNYAFDRSSSQLAFVTEEEHGDQITNAIWYYKDSMTKAALKVIDGIKGMDKNLKVAKSTLKFSKVGDQLFFNIQQKEYRQPQSNSVGVDIWNYKDFKLQSQQAEDLNYPIYFTAVLNIEKNQVVQLTYKNETLEMGAMDKESVNFILVNHREADYHESNWNLAAKQQVFLVSTANGSRIFLNQDENVIMSQYGNYAFFYDSKKRNYFVYEVATGTVRNITKNIATHWDYEEYDDPGSAPPFGAGDWLDNDSAVLIYDNYDIWQVDPTSKKAAINITNGFGSRHKIVFRLSNPFNLKQEELSEQKQSKLLLTALNKNNKYNGFFLKRLGSKGDPELLTMGPFIYHSPWAAPFPPIKARQADVFLVRRMSADDAPNYYITNDFKEYNAITDVHPEKKFNWITAELVRWKTFDGSYSEGILYKPENFDSNKKYPVIFNFYEKVSDRLYQYVEPGFNSSNINIPWFVSNGYLVFTPDIHYKIGEPGKSAYNSIVSAAKYISRIKWVDSTKLGIQGHSFGGYEVYYLVTRTGIFAAASSGAGLTNYICGYGGLWWGGISRQWIYETNQCRIGNTLWERPDLFIKNSPILRANKITTPLLIMHNKNDESVPWSEGVEMFTALRRLGRKCWMLQYDGEAHGISGNSQIDYHLRLTQFFNHYLKGSPAPKWMTIGVRAELKGIDTGLELDVPCNQP